MRIYGLIVLNGWFNGVVTIVEDGCCGCGGVVDGRKSGGVGSAISLTMEGGWFVKSGGWAALMDSLWGGSRLRLTWGCGVW